MDVDTIKPGRDFVDAVQQAVGGCDGLVAIIGREWLTIPDAAGARRLEDPEDLVKIEIATALERGIRVIPVLVQGAQMPRGTDLPEGLKDLANRNALEVSDTRFRSDVDRLIEALEAPAQIRVGGVGQPFHRCGRGAGDNQVRGDIVAEEMLEHVRAVVDVIVLLAEVLVGVHQRDGLDVLGEVGHRVLHRGAGVNALGWGAAKSLREGLSELAADGRGSTPMTSPTLSFARHPVWRIAGFSRAAHSTSTASAATGSKPSGHLVCSSNPALSSPATV